MDFNHDRVEARSVAFTDIDASSDGGKFTGYAAVFDAPADLGAHTESVNRGAFRKSLSNGSNVPMLYDHNPALPVLATTGAGTLKLKEDGRGLRVEADIARHFIGDAVREMVKRGEIRGMSFGFIAGSGNSRIEQRGGKPHRTLTGFKHLLDVSPTWNPAYVDTNAELRSLHALKDIDPEEPDSMLQALAALSELRNGEFLLTRTATEFRSQVMDLFKQRQSIDRQIEAVIVSMPDPGPAPILTPNEARETQNLPPVEGDDVKRVDGEPVPVPSEAPDQAPDVAPDVEVPPVEVPVEPDVQDGVEAPAETTEEQRSGVEPVDETAAAARRRKLQLMSMSLGAS